MPILYPGDYIRIKKYGKLILYKFKTGWCSAGGLQKACPNPPFMAKKSKEIVLEEHQESLIPVGASYTSIKEQFLQRLTVPDLKGN